MTIEQVGAARAAATLDGVEVHFASGLPGFPDVRSFRVTPWGGDDSPFVLLDHVGDPEVAFLAVPPGVFFPGYCADLGADDRARLELEPDDVPVELVLVTAPGRPEDATANLLGPLVVNTRTGKGRQVVLDDRRWSTRVPLIGPDGG